jgi:hypothetical protein
MNWKGINRMLRGRTVAKRQRITPFKTIRSNGTLENPIHEHRARAQHQGKQHWTMWQSMDSQTGVINHMIKAASTNMIIVIQIIVI